MMPSLASRSTGSRHRPPSAPILLSAIILVAAAQACELEKPYVRTNEFDPKSIYRLSLVGPDSSHSVGERVTLELRSVPELPARRRYVEWIAYDHVKYLPGFADVPVREKLASSDGDGSFIVIAATAEYREISLSAELDEVVVGHRLTVGQKAVELALSCSPWTLPFDPCDDVAAAPFSTISIHARMRDPLQNGLRAVQFAIARASVVSRDPSVVAPEPITADVNGVLRVRALSAGTTWVVVRIDDAIDSIRVAVAP